jgi:hypothetical protein
MYAPRLQLALGSFFFRHWNEVEIGLHAETLTRRSRPSAGIFDKRRNGGADHHQTTDGSPAPSAAPGLPSIGVVMVMMVAVLMIVVMVMMMRILRQFDRALNGRGV